MKIIPTARSAIGVWRKIGMNKTLYVLYYFYEGIGDCYKRKGTFNTMEELLKYHKNNRNSQLFNYPDYGQDYVEKYILEEPYSKECIYHED